MSLKAPEGSLGDSFLFKDSCKALVSSSFYFEAIDNILDGSLASKVRGLSELSQRKALCIKRTRFRLALPEIRTSSSVEISKIFAKFCTSSL